MLEPLPVRVYAARRAAAAANLRSSGMPAEVAERWLSAWEAYAAQEGLDRDSRYFWQRADEWIQSERHRGR